MFDQTEDVGTLVILDEAQGLMKYNFFYPTTFGYDEDNLRGKELPHHPDEKRPLLSRCIVLSKKNTERRLVFAGTRVKLGDFLKVRSSIGVETTPEPFFYNFDYLCAGEDFVEVDGLSHIPNGVYEFLRSETSFYKYLYFSSSFFLIIIFYFESIIVLCLIYNG